MSRSGAFDMPAHRYRPLRARSVAGRRGAALAALAALTALTALTGVGARAVLPVVAGVALAGWAALGGVPGGRAELAARVREVRCRQPGEGSLHALHPVGGESGTEGAYRVGVRAG